jgi:uncharacterized membrane protein
MKSSTFILGIISLVVGGGLYKLFDFQNLTFDKPALAILYFIVFAASIYMIIKNYKSQPDK